VPQGPRQGGPLGLSPVRGADTRPERRVADALDEAKGGVPGGGGTRTGSPGRLGAHGHHTGSRDAIGPKEQMFGTNEQVRGLDQNDLMVRQAGTGAR
jgi:hypothetical protein